jgi:hypothetical protein
MLKIAKYAKRGLDAVSHSVAESTFFRLGASRLLHLYWFRGLQGGTPSKTCTSQVALIYLGGKARYHSDV